jgi:hypothetical protein
MAHILDNEQMNALTMVVATRCKKDQPVRGTKVCDEAYLGCNDMWMMCYLLQIVLVSGRGGKQSMDTYSSLRCS